MLRSFGGTLHFSLLLGSIMLTAGMLLVSCSTVPFHEADQAQSLSDAGKYEQAIEWYSRSINLDPYNVDAYLGRGYAYEKLGQYDKALSDYTQVVTRKPRDPQARFVRGLLYDVLGETDKAIQDYSAAIDLKPDFADAYYYRGMDWERLRNIDAAKNDYRKAASFGNADAQAKLASLGGG